MINWKDSFTAWFNRQVDAHAQPEPLGKECKWQSVKERMPECSHNDIVVWNGRWARTARCLGSIQGGGLYFYTHEDVKLKGITHWHPLQSTEGLNE